MKKAVIDLTNCKYLLEMHDPFCQIGKEMILTPLLEFLESLFICVMDGSVKTIKMGNKLYEIHVDILETDE